MSSEEKLTFGSYEVLRQDGSNIVLGKGGFGRIYKARHMILGRIAALKVIKEESMRSGDSKDREMISEFKAEARAVAKMNHPGIANIHDCASEDGVFYQATEYCEGGTLQEYCQRNGPIPWNTARPMVIKILRGLEYAHASGIVHRDIKPSNIMLAKAGSLDEPKIIDFGLAKSLLGETADSAATLRGDVEVGGHTPATASPEQLRGSQDEFPDGRTDIFSLGVSIWWVLIGKNPFEDLKTGPLYADRLGPASYEGRLPEDLDPEAREILLKMLEKNREKRISSASDVLAILEPSETPEEKPENGGEDVSSTPATKPLPAPPDFDDGWRLGNLVCSIPNGKIYEVESLADSTEGLAINANQEMETRLLAGMRVAASRGLDLGVFRFLDWRLNGLDDAFVISPPDGCSLLAVLRKVGFSRFKDALPFFLQIAKSFDTSVDWLGCGIQIDPPDILVKHVSGGSDPEMFSSWEDIDLASVSCLPLFEQGGEGASSTEATISTSTQGFPPLARFAAMVYRVVSGSAVSHAAFYTDSGYVMASGFSEDGNALIADTLCDPEPDARLGHFLQMLASLESQPIGEIVPICDPPQAGEIDSATLPLDIDNREIITNPRVAKSDNSSVDDEIAELQKQIERKKSEAAARKAAEEAAAKQAEEERIRQEEEKRLAEAAEAARIVAEAEQRKREAREREAKEREAKEREAKEREAKEREAKEREAAKAKADFEKKLKREAKEAAERAERERQHELEEERKKKEKEERLAREEEERRKKLAAEAAAAEAAKLDKEKKDAEAKRLAAEKESKRIALLEEKRKLDEKRAHEERLKQEEKRALEAKRKEEEKLRKAEQRKQKEDKKAAALAAKNQPRKEREKDSEAETGNSAGRKKIFAIAAILVLAAIVSAIFFLIGDDEPEPVVDKPPLVAPEPIVETKQVEPDRTPDPVVEIPPAKPSTTTVSFRKENSVGDDGYDYATFEIQEGSSRARKKESGADGKLTFDGLEPGVILEITLIGDIGSKKSVGLASRKIKLPDKAPEKPINVILPARLPMIVINNPHEIVDYREFSVTFPETKTQPADLISGGTNTLSIEDFEPKSALFVSGRKLPAKGEDASFPVAGSGEWTISYEGGVLEPTTETVSVHGEALRYPKSLPEPFSGKYSIVVPMTRFPSEAARNKITKTGNPGGGKPFKIPYYNEMVYVTEDKYQDVRKSMREILSGQDLPHYIGLILDLNFSKGGASAESKVRIVRIYPHMEVFHSECEVTGVTRHAEDSIRLELYSAEVFGGGYSLPGTEKWAEEFLKLVNNGRNRKIHPFVLKSMDEWVAWFSGSENDRAPGGASSMKFSEWKYENYPERFSVILTMEEGDIHLTEVSQVMGKGSLYKGHADDADLPERVHAVFYETATTEPVSKLKPIGTGAANN